MGVALLAGCGPSSPAGLAPLADRTATVGVELEILLRATLGHDVQFSWDSDVVDLATRPLKPTLVALDGGEGMFRWTPLADDVGAHLFRFTAANGGGGATVSLTVTVQAGADPILFREPVGDGTTLDLTRASCADVKLLVEDTSATQVSFEAGALWADNVTLLVDGPLSAALRFCPAAAQAQATTVFSLSIVARDPSGGRAEKRYTIVLGALAPPPPPPTNPCDAVPPSITHKPHPSLTTRGNLHLYATLSDESGISDAAVYWSTSAPLDPAKPDLTQMQRATMLVVGGTATAESVAATLPNPNATAPSGTQATFYYLLRATDADNRVAGCPTHTTANPTSGVYSFVVSTP